MGWTTKNVGVPRRESNLDYLVVQPVATLVHALCKVQSYLLNIICMNFRILRVNREL
jgi:hypothetical protein